MSFWNNLISALENLTEIRPYFKIISQIYCNLFSNMFSVAETILWNNFS